MMASEARSMSFWAQEIGILAKPRECTERKRTVCTLSTEHDRDAAKMSRSKLYPFTTEANRSPSLRKSMRSTPNWALGAEATTLQGFFCPSALYRARGT